MRVGLIGHRGPRLGTSKEAITLWIYEVLSFLFQDQEEQAMICGGAEGADELFGRVAHNFENADLYLYLPVKGYRSKKMDPWLRAAAKSEVYMSEQWQPGLDSARDKFLINNSDILLVVWDGIKEGGTWEAIEYAQAMGVPMIYFPQDYIRKEKERALCQSKL